MFSLMIKKTQSTVKFSECNTIRLVHTYTRKSLSPSTVTLLAPTYQSLSDSANNICEIFLTNLSRLKKGTNSEV